MTITGNLSENIGKTIEGIDHKKRPVSGRIIGVDPRPERLADGPYYVVQPSNPKHDAVLINALAYVRCESDPAIDPVEA